jgi:hypothetical protein
VPSSEAERTKLVEKLSKLAYFENNELITKATLLGFVEQLDQTQKMGRTHTLAILEVSKELKRLVINCDKTIAMISKARGIGERALRQARVEAIEKTTIAEPSATAG